MLAAPNRIKQPRITTAPWRQLIRPESISRPTTATAITATTVATVPSSVPWIQRAAPRIAPEPWGSVASCWAWTRVGVIDAIIVANRDETLNTNFKTPESSTQNHFRMCDAVMRRWQGTNCYNMSMVTVLEVGFSNSTSLLSALSP